MYWKLIYFIDISIAYCKYYKMDTYLTKQGNISSLNYVYSLKQS